MNFKDVTTISGEYSRGFDAGHLYTLKFVLEYLEEVPSAQGLEGLIKKIQQRNAQKKETA